MTIAEQMAAVSGVSADHATKVLAQVAEHFQTVELRLYRVELAGIVKVVRAPDEQLAIVVLDDELPQYRWDVAVVDDIGTAHPGEPMELVA